MKKELILLACMTAGPCLLNSAGKRADTNGTNTRRGAFGYTILNSNNPMYSRPDIPAEYGGLTTRILNAYAPSSGNPSSSKSVLSRALLEREQTGMKSGIMANWMLDTVASQHKGALIYMDKDNPELKAIIFTDNSGNMLIRLEQDGKCREVRVKKVEFHIPLSAKPREHHLNELMKSTLALKRNENMEAVNGIRKGAGYVPV